ncbi:hypothetical protein ACFPLB_02590 [Aquamicrobium segne]|uniref:BPL/LPL catalytic domain-containing protein n=1 Tax=Aquamicrobium segne TaxID=469547 RepID=A0ABW0GWP2_9HYPH
MDHADNKAAGVLLHLSYEEALARERAMLVAESNSDLRWMLWQTAPCIVVPRSHENNADFAAAVMASAARGWPVQTRDTGGGAVVQGSGVVNLSMVFCMDDSVSDRIGASYRILCEPVMAMLRCRSIEGTYRAIPGTMCDGIYNIVVGEQKLAGTAQRWRSLGRQKPGQYAVLAHLALFVDLDHAQAAKAINALYADMGVEAAIEATTHINWTQIDAGSVGDVARELDAACLALRR